MIIKYCWLCGEKFIDRTDNKGKKYCSRKCNNKYYRLIHKKKIISKSRQYYLKHRKKIINKNKQYQLNNKEKRYIYNKEYSLKNEKYLKEKAKKRCLKNKEHILKRMAVYSKNRYQTDINYRLKKTLKDRTRRALKGLSKVNRTMQLVDSTIEELHKYLEKQFYNNKETNEAMTWDNYGMYGWHIDHIKPCASFDLRCPVGQLACFHYSNLQPLWAKENYSKGAKILDIPNKL